MRVVMALAVLLTLVAAPAFATESGGAISPTSGKGHSVKLNSMKVAAEATCTLDGKSYSVGATACRAGELHECNKSGEWVNLRQKCK